MIMDYWAHFSPNGMPFNDFFFFSSSQVIPEISSVLYISPVISLSLDPKS